MGPVRGDHGHERGDQGPQAGPPLQVFVVIQGSQRDGHVYMYSREIRALDSSTDQRNSRARGAARGAGSRGIETTVRLHETRWLSATYNATVPGSNTSLLLSLANSFHFYVSCHLQWHSMI